MKFEFSRQIFRKSQISSFIKIRSLRAELFFAHRQTDMTELIVAFRSFANAPDNRMNKGHYCLQSRMYQSFCSGVVFVLIAVFLCFSGLLSVESLILIPYRFVA